MRSLLYRCFDLFAFPGRLESLMGKLTSIGNRIWLKRFVGGRPLVSAINFGLRLMFAIIWNRSTRPPGGNQIDGLPPALSLMEKLTFRCVRGYGLCFRNRTYSGRGNF